jgi:simple sugar transport system ATP-binding protein
MSDFIAMRGVAKTYAGVRALKGIDFQLKRGEVHCLCGENGSGKSTLIKILSGVVKPDAGSEISIDGKVFPHLKANEAIEQGVRVIYQDLALFPNLTVKENIAFQTHSAKGSPLVGWRALEKTAREAMSLIGLDLDLDRLCSTLPIAQQQLIEITKALIGDLKLLVLDEPTASLTRKEVNALFQVIAKLRARGVTVLFVSHKLNEVFEIAERVTVLRDGDKIGEYAPSELDHKQLVYLMTGKKYESAPPKTLASDAGDLLEVRGLSKAGEFQDVSFTLKKGEILGITGLLGSGRTELAMSLFGMNPADSGQILLEGKPVDVASNRDAVKLGIGYVPEDRLLQGIVQAQSILDNISLTVLESLKKKNGLLDMGRMISGANQWVADLSIKIPFLAAPARTLSGGNQQKVVLSKWLATRPKLLILDEPTIGIDVLAKNGVHDLVKKLAEQGIGILFISDEIPEVLSNCHRVLVMQKGKIVLQVFPGPDAERDLFESFNLS